MTLILTHSLGCRISYKVAARFTAAVMLLMLTGCQRPFEFRTEEEITNEVLSKDPAFANILEQKSKVDEQINTLKADFGNRNRILSEQISSLKNKLKFAKEDMDENVRLINSKLDPCRDELTQRIKGLAAELKLKESSLSATNKTITSYSKLSQSNTPVSKT
ncbi:MAG: hypothetical protein ABH843_02150, partial [Candidatus Omnitrophota bacterium]